MDDYFRAIEPTSPQAAHLNGDTCVLPIVESQKQAFRPPSDPDEWFLNDDSFDEMIFNITEDQGITESVPGICISLATDQFRYY
jgi:hypothetical protein